jgi:hypothetical protein
MSSATKQRPSSMPTGKRSTAVLTRSIARSSRKLLTPRELSRAGLVARNKLFSPLSLDDLMFITLLLYYGAGRFENITKNSMSMKPIRVSMFPA